MVHTSAVALAVFTLNAASAMAYNSGMSNDMLESRATFSDLSQNAVRRTGSLKRRIPYSDFELVRRAATGQASPIKGAPASNGAPQAPPGSIPVPSTTTAPKGGPKGPPSDGGPQGQTPTPTTGQQPNGTGNIPTRVVRVRPKATVCAPGETPARRRPSSGGRRSRHGAGRGHGSRSRAHGKGPAGHRSPGSLVPPKPDILPRGPSAVSSLSNPTDVNPFPTPSPANPNGPSPAPTAPPVPSPNGPAGGGSPGGGASGPNKVLTRTQKGKDGHPTVYLIHRATKTPCVASLQTQGAGGPKTGPRFGAKAMAGLAKSPDFGGKMGLSTGGERAQHKLAARYQELIERFYGETDELD